MYVKNNRLNKYGSYETVFGVKNNGGWGRGENERWFFGRRKLNALSRQYRVSRYIPKNNNIAADRSSTVNLPTRPYPYYRIYIRYRRIFVVFVIGRVRARPINVERDIFSFSEFPEPSNNVTSTTCAPNPANYTLATVRPVRVLYVRARVSNSTRTKQNIRNRRRNVYIFRFLSVPSSTIRRRNLVNEFPTCFAPSEHSFPAYVPKRVRFSFPNKTKIPLPSHPRPPDNIKPYVYVY